MSAASAGFFDFLADEPEIQNQTYEFDGCSLELPETYDVLDLGSEDFDGGSGQVYMLTDNETGDFFTLSIASGPDMVDNTDQFIANQKYSGVNIKKEGTYNNWTIVNYEDDDTVGITYGLLYLSDQAYMLEGDDLDNLKNIVDTFKEE